MNEQQRSEFEREFREKRYLSNREYATAHPKDRRKIAFKIANKTRLLAIDRDAYQEAIQKTWREMYDDHELIDKIRHGASSLDECVVIIISENVWRYFFVKPESKGNVERFHLALLEECVFELQHECDTMKFSASEQALREHGLI